MAAVKEKGDEELYNKLELAYPTEDDSEVGCYFHSNFQLSIEILNLHLICLLVLVLKCALLFPHC